MLPSLPRSEGAKRAHGGRGHLRTRPETESTRRGPMAGSIDFTKRWRYIVPIVGLLIALGLTVRGASAGRLSDTTAGLGDSHGGSLASPRAGSGKAPMQPQGDGYM